MLLDDSRPAALVYDAVLANTAADALARAIHTPALTAVVGDSADTVTPFAELSAAETVPDLPDAVTTYDETTRAHRSRRPDGPRLGQAPGGERARLVLRAQPGTPCFGAARRGGRQDGGDGRDQLRADVDRR